jgi:hypothetical protein
MAVAEFLVICAVCISAGIWIGTRPADPDGASPWSKLDPQKRRRIVLFAASYLAVVLLVGIAFATEHPTIGVAILLVGFMLPELLLLPRLTRRG